MNAYKSLSTSIEIQTTKEYVTFGCQVYANMFSTLSLSMGPLIVNRNSNLVTPRAVHLDRSF